MFQGCGGDDEERPTINNYYSDCEDNASEPPIPTYVTIEKKHLSHLSYARVIEHEREGDFLTYSAEGEKVISGVTRDSGIYKVVFQLSDGKWIHVGTVEPTPVSPF